MADDTSDYRIRALKRRKAQILIASNHEPYQRLGVNLMNQLDEEDAAETAARRQDLEDFLKLEGIDYQRKRDALLDQRWEREFGAKRADSAADRQLRGASDAAQAERWAQEFGFKQSESAADRAERQRRAQADEASAAASREERQREFAALQDYRKNQLGFSQRQLDAEQARWAQEQGQQQGRFNANLELKRQELAEQKKQFEASLEQKRQQGASAVELERDRLSFDQRQANELNQLLTRPSVRVTPEGSDIPNTQVPGKPTEAQRNAVSTSANNVANLNDALRLLRENRDAYGTKGSAIAGFAGELPGGTYLRSGLARFQSEGAQKTRGRVEAIVSDILRQQAGASMTEFEALKRQFLPQPFDDERMVRTKLGNLLTAEITKYRTNGGLDDLKVPQDEQQEPGTPAAPSSVISDLLKKYRGGR